MNRLFGAWLAILLLAGQVIAPGQWFAMHRAMAAEAAVMELARATICHDSDRNDAKAPMPDQPPAGQAHDCGLCGACHVGGADATLPLAAVFPAPALASRILPVVLPPPSGPPGRFRSAAHPRGPPDFSV